MTLDELVEPLTLEEARASIYATLATKGVTTTTWKPGAVVRTIIAALAILVVAFSRLQALVGKSGFLELSEGDWLTEVARNVYGVERDLGSFATGNVELDNASTNVYSGVAGDLVFAHATTGKTYRNTAAFSVGSLALNVLVPVQADELGSGSNANPGTITVMKTPLAGVTATNPTALVGNDVEADPALRTRSREKTGVLSPMGPRDAYAYVAKSVKRADGSSVGVTRVKTVPDGVGGVTVYIADADGPVAGPDVTLVADAIHKLVEPLSITPNVQSAVAKLIVPTYTLWVRDTSGMSNADIAAAVQTKLTDWLATQPIGGWIKPTQPGRVYLDAIRGVIVSTLGNDLTIDVDLTVPAADVDILSNEAPVLGTPTATIIQITGGTT